MFQHLLNSLFRGPLQIFSGTCVVDDAKCSSHCSIAVLLVGYTRMAGQRDDVGPPCVEDMSMGLMTRPTVKIILRLLHVGLLVGVDPSLILGPAMAVQWHLLSGSWEVTSQGPAWPPGRDRNHGQNCSHKPSYSKTVYCLYLHPTLSSCYHPCIYILHPLCFGFTIFVSNLLH